MRTIAIKVQEETRRLESICYNSYLAAAKAVCDAAKKHILAIVRQIVPDGKTLNTYGLINDMSLDNVYKYDTPRDYPSNFVIVGVTVNKGKLEFSAVDTDDEDNEWTFEENSVTAAEWNSLCDYFTGVANLLLSGDAVIGASTEKEIHVISKED